MKLRIFASQILSKRGRAVFWAATAVSLTIAIAGAALIPEEKAVPAMAYVETGQDVNLFAFPQPSPGATLKSVEVEPEELPQPGDIRIEVVRRTHSPEQKKRVLIYHTHTWEAYEPTPENSYTQTERWRTKDNAYNVVKVGDVLAQELTKLGMEVVHDATAHEPPVLSTAYTRSLQTLEAYRERGEIFDYYIDLHRDAYVASMAGHNSVTDGEQSLARIMVLIGKGTGASGGEAFEQKPNWEINIVLAQAITDALNAQVENLCYPVKTKTGRFNQHISEGALLIEVGNNMNTLEEAMASMPYLARAIVQATQ